MADTSPFLLRMIEHLVKRFEDAENVELSAADQVLFLPDSNVMFGWKHNETRFIVASGDDWRVAVDFFLQNPNMVRVCLDADPTHPSASFEHTHTFRCLSGFDSFVDRELVTLVASQMR